MQRMRVIDNMRDFVIYWRDYSGEPLDEMLYG
jgi:hypothetical protein